MTSKWRGWFVVYIDAVRGEFLNVILHFAQTKESDREEAMEELHSLLAHGGRGALLSKLCQFLGKKRVRELREFMQTRHPASVGLVPPET